MSVSKIVRKTLLTSQAKAAPWRVLIVTLPLWGASMLLMFVMPLTGIVGSILIVCCLFVLPFKAKQGDCPECGRYKMFPFSGFGSVCKGCGYELVLRGNKIHLLQAKSKRARLGSGRSNRS